MKNIVKVAGAGIVTAAAAIICITAFKTSNTEEYLKEAATVESNSFEGVSDEPAFENAVTKNPVFTYTGSKTEVIGNSKDVSEDILVTDVKGGYEDTLTNLLSDGTITLSEVHVTDDADEETENVTVTDTTITFSREGIYHVTVTGKDTENNKASVSFYMAVNRQKKGEN